MEDLQTGSAPAFIVIVGGILKLRVERMPAEELITLTAGDVSLLLTEDDVQLDI